MTYWQQVVSLGVYLYLYLLVLATCVLPVIVSTMDALALTLSEATIVKTESKPVVITYLIY